MPLNWLVLSLGGAICFTIVTLLFRLMAEKGISSLVGLASIIAISSIIVWMYTFFVEKTSLPPNSIITILLIGGIASAIGNILLFKGIIEAPNPGYAEAVGSLRIIFITIVAIFLFSLKPQPLGIIGVILVVIGLILLSSVG